MIIDATNLILGRLATISAKKVLLGEKVDIVNCEKAVVTGNRAMILSQFKRKVDLGIPLKGPYYPRMPDRIIRRTVRGMLPWKRTRGKEAFKRVMCYIGVPDEFKDKKIETIKEANVSKMPNLKYITVGEISKSIGGKWQN
ncbi:50S ribosomal protein L13 [Candidatus Woesearchaeota archaeon CG10_big_fil_rev_8_21_14_0_10_44_13]|nr:MAG: 50S ribosomal protein L13 [Candidatus Woesearchaeota archaeon CG10_big_fil_rev_8_21_14_0_10_44_13]